MSRLDLPAPGPVILRGLADLRPYATDAPSEAEARIALVACAAAGRRILATDIKAQRTWTDKALHGLATMEAEGALLDLGIDLDDVPAGLMSALVGEFMGAYRAC